MDWRLLVKESIAYIGIPLDLFKCRFDVFLRVEFVVDFWFFANRLTVHNGGVSRAVAVGVSDR